MTIQQKTLYRLKVKETQLEQNKEQAARILLMLQNSLRSSISSIQVK